ncbi:MAG: type 4a pilus biogenesis protein PilO [bacterium]
MVLKPTNLNFNFAKVKEMVLPIVFITVALAVLFLVGFKSFTSLSGIKEEIIQSGNKLTELVERRGSLEVITGMSGVLEENIVLSLDALPEKDEISALLSQFQQISGESGLKLSSLQYTGSSKEEISENGLYVQIAVEGSYQKTVKFLELLESARRIVSFESLRLNAISKEDPSVLSVSLSATGYYLKPTVVKTGLSGDVAALTRVDFRSNNLNKVLENLRLYKKYENIAPIQPEVIEEIPEEEVVEPVGT